MSRRLIAGSALAALWLLCGLGPYALQLAGGPLATLARMIPSPMSGSFFGLPPGWAITVHVVAVVLIIAGYAMIVSWFASQGRTAFAAGWIAAVLTGFLVGVALDLGSFVTRVEGTGLRGALAGIGATPSTVFWAFVVGWIPAMIVRSISLSSTSERASDARPNRPRRIIAVTVVAVVAAIALPLAAQAAHDAAQQELRQEQANAAANADPDGAAPRDPDAAGNPVPNAAASSVDMPADACASENSTIMAPAADAATGHRLQTLHLVNTSDAPCMLEGYPDIAFGDQNGHLLDVTVEHGRSFMAEDPGPTTITLQPGASATAGIGWDANSVRGNLAARTLWAAAFPGVSRLSWEVSLDIIPGTTVHVTAWRDATPGIG